MDDLETRDAATRHWDHEASTTAQPKRDIRARMRQGESSTKRSWARQWGIPAFAIAATVVAVIGVSHALVGSEGSSVAGPDGGGAVPRRQVEVYFLTGALSRDGDVRHPPDHLAPEVVLTEDTGDAGLDAVRALLTTRPQDPDYANGFDLLTIDPAPITGVNGVSVLDGVINVDLTKDVWDPYPSVKCMCPSGEIVMQQLVWTVQQALDSSHPVTITVNGEPTRGIWLERLDGPVPTDPSALEPVLIDRPTDGATVSSPVTVTGTSDTSDAEVMWQVRQVGANGQVVEDGATTGGMGERTPFRFTVQLPPGDYTIRAYWRAADGGGLSAGDTKAVTVG